MSSSYGGYLNNYLQVLGILGWSIFGLMTFIVYCWHCTRVLVPVLVAVMTSIRIILKRGNSWIASVSLIAGG